MSKKHNCSILNVLITDKTKSYTIKDISKRAEIDYKATYITIQELKERGTILTKKVGNTTLCSLNPVVFNDDIFCVEYERSQNLLKKPLFQTLCSYFENIDPFFVLLLFGSHAKGVAMKGSDIDLLLIANSKLITSKIEEKISLLPFDVHLSSFTTKEFTTMLMSKKFNVGTQAHTTNIILYGIENYYRLIQNALERNN